MPSISPRETLDRAIDDLLAQVVEQSLMVESSIKGAVRTLNDRDIDQAKSIYNACLLYTSDAADERVRV